MGNSRGNIYSRGHKTLDPYLDAEKYFEYSFFESGAYDIPAMVDYIRNYTGQDKIGYMGYSQGTA